MTFRVTRNRSREESLTSGDSLIEDDQLSGIVPHTKFIFVRHCFLDLDFFKGAAKTFELLDAKGQRVFYGKVIPSKVKNKNKNKIKGEDVLISIADLIGQNILVIEGHHGGHTTFAVYLKGREFLGEIVERKTKCTKQPYFDIFDRTEEHKFLIKLTEESRTARGNCCKHWCGGFSSIDDEHLTFDIFLGNKIGRRIGGIGIIAPFFPEIPLQLNQLVGVELQPDVTSTDKLLLIATIFIRQIPLNSEPDQKPFNDLDVVGSNVEYWIEMNSGDDSYNVREAKTSTEDSRVENV